MRLKLKITILTLIAAISSFLFVISVSTFLFYSETKQMRNNEIQSSFAYYLNKVNQAAELAVSNGLDIAKTGEMFHKLSRQTKTNLTTDIENFLIDKVTLLPTIIGAGLWFEPQTFGQRYLGPYAYWDADKVAITWEYNTPEYDYPNQGWYTIAIPSDWKKTKKRKKTAYRTAPYEDKLGEKRVIFVTLSTLMYATPELDEKILGVSTVDWTFSTTQELLKIFKITPSSYAVLADTPTKKIIFHPEDRHIMKNLSDLSWFQKLSMEDIGENEIRVANDVNIDGREFQIMYTTTSENYFLAALIDKKEAFAVVSGILYRSIFIAFLAIAIMALLIYYVVGKSILPLQQIIDVLRDISTGAKGLSERISAKYKDEFAELASTYNSMAETIEAQTKEIKDYAENLEQMVEKRTIELNESLREVTALKLKQDGDYFLLSLLLNPLTQNRTQSHRIAIDFLVKQKKNFVFKNMNREIGGDYCYASDLKLRGKRYMTFCNGDAMGKSIQGAGGALIFATNFRAMVERTNAVKSFQDVYPEKWLKSAFIELHKVFEAFDGSMMISIVIGIIDEETGLLYFINAEHPFNVLYRDKTASFLEEELSFRKLGTPGQNNTISIKTFKMEPGDVILVGSDGRDDLILKNDSSELRIINEDETLFLRMVEKGDGNLEKICHALEEAGEFIDDLSLMRIACTMEQKPEIIKESHENRHFLIETQSLFREKKHVEAIEKLNAYCQTHPDQQIAKRLLIKFLFQSKRFDECQKEALDYENRFPQDSDIIFALAVSLKKNNDWLSSIACGERLLLREPTNANYLVHLIQCYTHIGNHDRIEDLLERLSQCDPKNKIFEKISLDKKETAITE